MIYEGVEQSLSAAALKAIHAMGYTWPSVNGFEYWTVDGAKLNAMARSLAARVDED